MTAKEFLVVTLSCIALFFYVATFTLVNSILKEQSTSVLYVLAIYIVGTVVISTVACLVYRYGIVGKL